MTKQKNSLWQNSKTQFVTKFKNSNSEKLALWQISIYDQKKDFKKVILVRTFWDERFSLGSFSWFSRCFIVVTKLRKAQHPCPDSLADMSSQLDPDEPTGQGVEEDDQADAVDGRDELGQGQRVCVLDTLQPDQHHLGREDATPTYDEPLLRFLWFSINLSIWFFILKLVLDMLLTYTIFYFYHRGLISVFVAQSLALPGSA